MTGRDITADIAIAGGGLNGLTLAITLARAGLSVAVADREDPARVLDAPYDGRASAIARGSQLMFETVGLWDHMAEAAEPILDIRVSDGRIGEEPSPFFLHYDHEEVGGPLGFIIENRAIRKALHLAAEETEGLHRLAPTGVDRLERPDGGAVMHLSDGRRISAPLAVAADGRNSAIREAAGIKTLRWDYPQAGIVCTVAHDLPHDGVAHEHFLPSGPFALLPMTDDEAGRHRSSLVWTEKRRLADHYMALDDDAFAAELERRFGLSLGRLAPAGARWSYPLSLLHAERYVDHRLALIGDAAHAIHPIAGQGLNLGLRDIAALAEVVVDAARLGLDPGRPEVLADYQRWRRVDNWVLTAATDSLNRLFSNDIAPLRLLRDVGMAAVGKVPPARRFLMRHAMGLSGELPRLVKGQPL